MLEKRISLGTDPLTGKQLRVRIRGKDEKELLREETKVRTEYENGINPSLIQFGKYAAKWVKLYKSQREEATRAMYEHILDKLSSLNHMPIRNIRSMDLQGLINANAQHPRTCEQMLLTAKQIFNHAIEDGIISRNPASNVELPKRKTPDRRILTDAERTAIMNAKLDESDRMFTLVLFYFGLRPAEALALMASDFKDNTLTVSRALTFENNYIPHVKGTKTDNVRTLPVPVACREELQEYRSKLDSPYLFTQRGGGPPSKSSLKRKWQRIKRAINAELGGTDDICLCPDLKPYIFRYSYATTLYYSGISIKKAAYLMGHADTSMILKIYAQIDDSQEDLSAVENISLSPERVQNPSESP